MENKSKDNRIDLRVRDSEKDFLIYAASARKMKLSAFVLSSALKEAEEVAAQTVHFALPPKQWKAFCQALDRSAREIPQLKKLFREPGVFNERKTV